MVQHERFLSEAEPVTRLIWQMSDLGVVVEVDADGQLHVDVPDAAREAYERLRPELREHRDEIVAALEEVDHG